MFKTGKRWFINYGFEKKSNPNEPYRTFRVTQVGDLTSAELWNMFCVTFDYSTNYDILVGLCKYYNTKIDENTLNKEFIQNKQIIEDFKKVDINNCSESELAKLPGISVVISKKLSKNAKLFADLKV